MQSQLTKVTRAQIKQARKAVMESVRKKGGGGYVTDGRRWVVKTFIEKDGDHDILLDMSGRISMKAIKEVLANRGEFDVWIEGQVDWHKNLKNYIDGNTDWEYGDLTDYWTVELAKQVEQ